MEKIFITGINGFAGSHLAEHLLAESEAQIHGLVKEETNRGNISEFQDNLQLHTGNLLNRKKINAILKTVQPDRIYHLAGLANPDEASGSPEKAYRVNVLGQLHLLETLVELQLSPRVLVVGSAAEYGRPAKKELPLSESAPLEPVDNYGTTKSTQDLMGYQYQAAEELEIIRVRPFNHTGPRRPAEYVCSSFARQAVLIEAGKKSPIIRTGDLQKIRDFSDVRDVVRAYRLALEQGEAGEVYNICSNEPRRILDVLELILELSGLEREKIKIKSSKKEVTSCDEIYGSARKLMTQTGWSARIPFRRTMQDLINYWRNHQALSPSPGGRKKR